MAATFGKIMTAILAAFGLLTQASAEIEIGQPAPAFRLQDQKGDWHTLEQYNGQWVVLYFYPKNDTPGCTKEACGFRDNIFAFEDIGAVVLGVSLDDVESHQAFAEKYSLPFSLLSDSEAAAATEYGVLKSIGPMKFAKRETFIIDPSGNVAFHYGKVNAETHSVEVLADLKDLIAAEGSNDS